MEHTFLTFLLLVVGCGAAAQWLGWRLKVPAIVLLLVLGLGLGPVGGLIDPSALFGDLLRPMIGAAVAIIVFEGGLSLNFNELDAAGRGVRRLVLLALPLNWLLGTVVTHWIGGLSWAVSLVLGAILVVTGPTVILPLLRQTRLRPRLAAVLKWEAVVNDPIGAALTFVVLEYLVVTAGWQNGDLVATALGLRITLASLAAVVLAALAALTVRWAFHADLVPEVQKTPVLLAGCITLYAAGNLAQAEIGLLAATMFGLVLGNIGITGIRGLSHYKESLSVLLVSGLFVVLAADLQAEVFIRLSWPVIGLVAALLLVRPLAIIIATIGAGLSWRERLLAAWVGPRGIVAAAVAGIAGGDLTQAGYPDGALVLPIVFLVIASTVLLQGLSLAPVARRLGLTASERPGLLIVGASPWAVELAVTVKAMGVPVVLADPSWQALHEARERAVPTAAVEILSAWVDETLDGGAIDYVLAASGDDAYNALVCARMAPELGHERVHQLAFHSGRIDSRHAPAPDWRGKVVGEAHLDYHRANELLRHGWRFFVHKVGEDAAAPVVESPAKPLLIVHHHGALGFTTPERDMRMHSGDCLVAFGPSGPCPWK